MDKSERICIIGAGVSGISTAYYLEKKGYKNVVVLEKSNRVGGKCNTLKYKGKTYELGSQMGFDSNHYLMELMEEFNVKKVGPILYRGFFDPRGNPVSQIDTKELYDFQEQFYVLPNILSEYKDLRKPGLKNIDPRLCIPFSQWLEENNIPLVGKVYELPFTGFGFGFFDEIAAAYVLKYLNFDILNSFIEITHIITLIDGYQVLWEKIASTLRDVRLSTNVLEVQRGKEVIVKTQLDTLEFDKLIITCGLDEALKFLDATEEEENLFSRIQYNDLYVFAYILENIPKVCGYIPEHFNRDKTGHLLAWYYRWQDIASNDLITVYAMGEEGMAPREVKAKVEEDLVNLGIKINHLYTYRKWKYFPHVDCEELKNGFHDKLEALQSKRNTYYTGEIMSFSIIEECLAYSVDLIGRFF